MPNPVHIEPSIVSAFWGLIRSPTFLKSWASLLSLGTTNSFGCHTIPKVLGISILFLDSEQLSE